MRVKTVTLFAVGLCMPVLALGQGAQRPPEPPPPQAGAPMQAPSTLPEELQHPVIRTLPYDQWAKQFYKVYKIPKKDAVVIGKNRVRPHRIIGVVMEIVGEDKDNYFVRNLPPEDPQSTGHSVFLRKEATDIFNQMKKEYFENKYLIVDNPVVPPPFTDQIRFVEADKGLPRGGRWQMSFDVADMNGDGRPDLVFGPQRTGPPTPYIVLQQEDHTWRLWATTKWPTKGLKLDYGSVRVADFDGDGNKDIAIACHFSKTYVLYGNGKGDFTRFVTIPQANPHMTSRSLTVADFNGDGRPDIATLAEVDLNMATSRHMPSGLVNVALNLPGGWQAGSTQGFPAGIQGDWLTTADIDGDGRPDLLLTSRAQNMMDLVFHNVGGAEGWVATDSLQMPVNAYVFANAAAPLDGSGHPSVVECFEQWNPWKVEPPTQACVIYRFRNAAGMTLSVPQRTVLFQEKVEYANYVAAAIGDLDGDGRPDIVVATNSGRVRVFLQGLDGSFYEQRDPGLDRPNTSIFDLKIADLYGDGKGEIIVAGSPQKEEGGGVWVFRATKAPTGVKSAAKPR